MLSTVWIVSKESRMIIERFNSVLCCDKCFFIVKSDIRYVKMKMRYGKIYLQPFRLYKCYKTWTTGINSARTR